MTKEKLLFLMLLPAASLLVEKTFHREAALQQDNSQWTGENRLLSPEDIVRLDALDRLQNNAIV